MTKIPADDQRINMDPDLARAIEAELAPLEGKDLAKAQKAVLEVRRSKFVGSFRALVERYRTAILEAVTS